jgi:hypothetical protein
MDPEETHRLMTELASQSYIRDLEPQEWRALADYVTALNEWLSRGGFLPKEWRRWREEAKANDEKASEVTVPDAPVSLGEQPHSPDDCFFHHGRPHLGPCMDAEAFTRWWWLEGPGSRPMSSTAIALATSKLVAEAFAARERRTNWPETARKLMTTEGRREILEERDA